MSAFHYLGGELFCEEVPLSTLAKEYGTPLFIYSQADIENRWKAYQSGLSQVQSQVQSHANTSTDIGASKNQTDKRFFYAVKANPNLGLLRIFHKLGAGFDTVSIGEIKRAMLVGAPAQDILFSGVGKSAAELEFAITEGIGAICVESTEEFQRLAAISQALGKTANLSVRINPDIQADTHPSIRTGGKEHKFGVSLDAAEAILSQANSHPQIEIIGISCHIGSQILDIAPFIQAAQKMHDFYKRLAAQGIAIKRISLGGGFGISYKSSSEEALPPTRIGELTAPFATAPVDLIFEPGRSLVAASGALLTKLEYIKSGESKNFAIVDAAMNDLLRPALYDAYHEVLPITQHSETPTRDYDIVGPVCESGDVLARQRSLAIEAGDLLAIKDIGAYGSTMSSNYNSRPRAAEVLINGSASCLIKRREELDDLLRLETGLEMGLEPGLEQDL